MEIDVIFLTKTCNDNYYSMTKDAIESLISSETNHKFNIIVVESEIDCKFKYDYDNCETVFFDESDFNYNKAVNLGLSKSKNFWVAWSNNDVIFEKEWFTKIYNTPEFKFLELSSFSSYEPKWHQSHSVNFNENGIAFGYRTSYELCGWFILTNKNVIEMIGNKLDENFKFWYQDNDYSMSLLKNNIPHFLIKDSIIYHKISQSHDLLQDKKVEYTVGSGEIFTNKWSK